MIEFQLNEIIRKLTSIEKLLINQKEESKYPIKNIPFKDLKEGDIIKVDKFFSLKVLKSLGAELRNKIKEEMVVISGHPCQEFSSILVEIGGVLRLNLYESECSVNLIKRNY